MARYLTPEELEAPNLWDNGVSQSRADRWNKLGSAVDNTQGLLYGIGEAVGLPLGDLRRANQFEADESAQRYYRDTGSPRTFDEAQGVSGTLDWLGNAAIDSIPATAAIAAGGLVGGLPGAFAAGAAYGVGDVLDSQREQAGRTELGSAVPLGMAYGAADALLGVGGMAARRTLGSGIKALDMLGADRLAKIDGLKGVGARVGAGVLKTGAVESMGETFQEGMNQFGRMAVDSDQVFLDAESADRFRESAIGGFALGGVMGGVSGLRRGGAPDDRPKPRVEDQPNLLDRGGDYTPPSNGSLFGELEVPPQFSPVNGPIAEPQDLNAKYAELSSALGRIESGMAQAEQSGNTKLFYELASVRNQLASELAPIADQVTRQEAMSAGSQMGLFSQGDSVTRGVQPEAQPDYMQADMFGNVAATQEDIDRQNDPGAVMARQMWAEKQTSPAAPVGTTGKGAGATQPTQADPDADLKQILSDAGIKPNKKGLYSTAHLASAKAIAAADLDDETRTLAINTLGRGRLSEVERIINAAKSQSSVQPVAAATAPVGAQSPAAQAKTTGPQTGAGRVAEAGTVVGPTDTGAIAGIDPNKTVSVGRKGREKSVTPGQLMQQMSNASPLEKARIVAATGMDVVLDPTTGAPRLVQSTDAPATLEQIAEAESKATGKKVTKEAVRVSLLKYGITPEVVTSMQSMASGETYTDADLEIDPTDEASGYRIETELSKATGSGLIDDQNRTKSQREAEAKANELLKQAGPSTAVGAADDAGPTNLPPGAVVTDLREGNAAQIDGNVQTILKSKWGEEAAMWWDHDTVPYNQLPDTLKAEWVEDYRDNRRNNEGELNETELAASEDRIGRTYEQYFAPVSQNAKVRAATKTLGDANGDSGGNGSVRGAEKTTGAKPTLSLKAKKSTTTDAEVSASRKLKTGTPSWMRTATAVVPGEYSGPSSVVTDLDAFAGSHPGMRAAMDALDTAGLGEVLGEFDSIYIAHDSKAFDAKGSVYFDPASGTLQLWLDEAILNDAGQLQFTVQHEVAHVIDGAFGGPGLSLYSGATPLAMAPSGNASGVVARALKAEHAAQSDLGGVLDYPFNEKMSAPRKQEELFAQMFAVSLMGDKGQGFQKLPKVAQDFITKVVAHAQINADRTISRARTAAEAATQSTARPNNQSVVKRSGASQAAAYDGQAASRSGQPSWESSRRNLKAGALKKPAYMNKAPNELWESAKGLAIMLKDASFTRVAFTRNLLEAAQKYLPAATNYMRQMNTARVESNHLQRQVADIVERAEGLSAAERGTGADSVNDIISQMTYGNKWAFAPDWYKGATVDPTLSRKFNAMSREAQSVIKDVFRHGYETLKLAQQAALDSIKSEVDPLIAEARAKGDTETVKELEKAKADADGRFRKLMSIRSTTPYAPLKRYGNWAVVVKSQRYLDAEARNDEKELDELTSDGNHYQVEFVSNQFVARARARELEGQVGNNKVYFFERTDGNLLYGGESVFKTFSRFRNLARDRMDGETAKVVEALDKTLASMYVSLVAETSARSAEANRKNVFGADKDMLRAFATHGQAMAHFIGSLKTSGEVAETLRVMKGQVKTSSDVAQASVLYSEILRRHAMGLDYEPNQLLDKSLAFNSYWSLITSPSYLLTNLTQPWAVSLPYMAGKFGLWKTKSELVKAYKDIGAIALKLVDNPEAVSKLPDDVRDVVQKLLDRGSIDISIGTELGTFTSPGESKVAAGVQKAIRFPRTLAERGEMVNRVATAVAAYRLAKQAKMGNDAATDYADKVIYNTHGDYSAFNTPRFMRTGAGRLMTQFRKFQLIQLSLYARMISDSFGNGTPEEKSAARWALGYSLGTTFALGGVMAIPGFTAISFLLGALGDDDTPDDPEATLRRALGGGAEADALLRGIPNMLGLNLSNRIGAGGMLSILPYTDLEVSRDGYKDILLGVAGPFVGGTLPKALDGVGLIGNGDYWKGLEMLLPRGVADISKAARFGTEGITKRNGDVVLSGEDVGVLAASAQLFGLPTKSITDNQMLRNSQFKADEFYRDRTTDLKRDYVRAYRSNDIEKMGEVRAKWMETQAARKALGYPVQPLSTLLKSPQEQRKREAKPLNTALIQ